MDGVRDTFNYSTGERTFVADPLAVWRTLVTELDGEVDSVVARARRELPPGDAPPPESPAELKARAEAEGRLLAAARKAFCLPPLDRETGVGATDTCVWMALDAFWEWLEKNDGGRAAAGST